jgi:uncharacterized protein (DUF1697 family)
MKKWISLLRGINVGGSKKILMSDLKKLYEDLGYSQVSTYIQSGNVLFSADEKKTGSQHSAAIETAILKELEFEIPVITLSIEEVKHLLEKNPLMQEKNPDPEHMHLALFQSAPDPASLKVPDPAVYAPDHFVLYKNAAFVYCPNGYGKTKLTNTFFEKKTGMAATSRSLRTMMKLAELGEVMERARD